MNHPLKAHAEVASRYVKVNVLHELQYRANLFIQVFQSASQVAGALVALGLVYSRVDDLNGWTESELLAVIGVYTLLGGVMRTFFQPAMMRMMEDVQRGTFDFALTKPVDAQLLASVRSVDVWQGLDIVVGGVIITIAVLRMDGSVGVVDSLLFVGLLATGAAIIYAVWLIIAAAAFWFIKVDSVDVVYVGTFRATQYPIGIYPAWLRISLSTVLPLGLAVTAPAQAITSRLDGGTLGASVGVALAALVVSRLVWLRGLSRYSGASA